MHHFQTKCHPCPSHACMHAWAVCLSSQRQLSAAVSHLFWTHEHKQKNRGFVFKTSSRAETVRVVISSPWVQRCGAHYCCTFLRSSVLQNHGIYFTCSSRKELSVWNWEALLHKLETWLDEFSLIHSKQAKQIPSLPLEAADNRLVLPIGGFLLWSQLNPAHNHHSSSCVRTKSDAAFPIHFQRLPIIRKQFRKKRRGVQFGVNAALLLKGHWLVWSYYNRLKTNQMEGFRDNKLEHFADRSKIS